MKDSRQDIERRLNAARARAAERIAALHDHVSLTEYRALVKVVDGPRSGATRCSGRWTSIRWWRSPPAASRTSSTARS